MLYRASFISSGLKTKSGLHTGGIYTFLQSLQFCAKSFNIIVAFDGGVAPWRREIYPGYKVKPPKDKTDPKIKEVFETMGIAFQYLPVVLRLMGIPVIQVDNQEADDIIYRLSQYFKKKQIPNIQLVSEDEDYLQMVCQQVHVHRPIKKDTVYMNNFKDKTGIMPHKVVLKKALTGDTSDTIPGVYNIGEKTALKYLSQMVSGTPDELFELIANLKDKRSISIKENKEIVLRNMALMDLSKCHLQEAEIIPVYKESIEKAVPDIQKVTDIFRLFEFNMMDTWLNFTRDKMRINSRSIING